MRFLNHIVSLLLLTVLLAFADAAAVAQPWQPVGPDGGTLRSLTFDPKNPDRIFLGTSAGRLYLSTDNGASWSRYAHLGSATEMVLDHVIIDPANSRNIYVAAWNAQSPNSDGDIFRSRDGGKTWDLMADMHGKSIRALAMAASDTKTLVAGALDGIYRTRDGGDTWTRISPEHHAEIKNVESVAIDPANPDIIYAGTWHLPWKTDDGGKTWHSIKKGVIDDSDVFTILIDSQNPASLYISACSGIYRSETAGEMFRKIQGIPYSARRTRMLQMDPTDHKTVYAGTTEGLWKTTDGGANWKRTTGSNLVINDVMIDPRRPQHVLLATDRSGVLASDDGGMTFTAVNRGFTHRQVATLLVDRRDKSIVYAGLLNDKEFGGVFVSRDTGQSWTQISDGLDGRDVLVLRQANDNSLVAGTDRGIFQFKLDPQTKPIAALNPPEQAKADVAATSDGQPKAETPAKTEAPVKTAMPRWQPRNTLIEEKPEAPAKGARKTESAATKTPPVMKTVMSELSARVTGLEIAGQSWYAVTSAGLLMSKDAGGTWRKADINAKGLRSVAVADRMVVAASANAVAVSVNGGESWITPKPLETDFVINSVSVEGNGNIWLAAREGVFRSSDVGDTWKRIPSLRLSNVVSVQFDEENQRILATGAASSNVFSSSDNGRTWEPINAGWMLRTVRSAGGRLLGTTPFDGVIVQPEAPAAAPPAVASGTR
jgi:photosystem II stability/assembly factor-like uncharacterized protein